MVRKILLVTILLIFSLSPIYVYGDDLEEEVSQDFYSEIEVSTSIDTSTLDLNSRSCVVIDRLSKQILYGKNEKNQVKMASTTKIMTAIVVLENSALDTTVQASKKAAGTGGSRLGLKTGDKITIRDLLYGLMLCSGNDAAVCLAESVAGSVPEFSNLMNNKAQELGLTNSHFESPHGLDSDGHFTTAYELALLADYALQNSTFFNIVGTKNYTVTINGYPKNLSNTNELLGNLNGVYGVKTGFTNGANRCLVSSCKRGDMDIICVVLGADTKNFRTKDSIKLIEYTFKTYEYFNIKDFVNNALTAWENKNQDFFFVEKGVSNKIALRIDSSLDDCPVIPVKKDLISNLETSISMENYLKAPVLSGSNLGNLVVSSSGNTIAEFSLYSDTDILKNNVSNYILNFFRNYPKQLEQVVF